MLFLSIFPLQNFMTFQIQYLLVIQPSPFRAFMAHCLALHSWTLLQKSMSVLKVPCRYTTCNLLYMAVLSLVNLVTRFYVFIILPDTKLIVLPLK